MKLKRQESLLLQCITGGILKLTLGKLTLFVQGNSNYMLSLQIGLEQESDF